MIISQHPLNHLLNYQILDLVYLAPVPHLNFEPRRFFAILPHRIRIHQNYQALRPLDRQCVLFGCLALVLPL